MADEPNKDPDLLLSAIQKTEANQGRGKLKVFLGMSPGVGKTFAMLEAARRELDAGKDIVIGYVETHGRRETDGLAKTIPTIPRRTMDYRGVSLQEMDLDAVLMRHPRLALVDELAHTNAAGSRHAKRFQDVLELLNAGIDVFTTLNVQHVESRAEIVREITGATVHETVPDSILDDADIELVDLPPGELMRRLSEGKVYLPGRAEAAARNFFREGNLTALREIALRLAAEHVGQDVRDYLQSRQIAGPWKTGQRLLVAISPSPLSESMARWTRRLAGNLQAPWLAIHVDTGQRLNDEQQARLNKNLELARELGAEVIATTDRDIVAALLRIARQNNVTQIVVGKPAGFKALDLFRGGSVLSRLIRDSGNIDVHCVRAEGSPDDSTGFKLAPPGAPGLAQYGIALGVVAAVTVVNFFLRELTGHYALSLVYLMAVVVLALFLRRGPVIAAASVSALLWNYFFLPPVYTLFITNFQDAMMFCMFFVIAIAMGQLTARIRSQQAAEREREERSTSLYLLTRELAEAKDMAELLGAVLRKLGDTFSARVALLLPNAGPLEQLTEYPFGTFEVSEKEMSVADWTFRNRKPAGADTDTLPSAEATYIPLVTASGCIGVIGLKPNAKGTRSTAERSLLESFVRQIALVLDRQRLSDIEHNIKLIAESERLGKTLLNSISHELRTPIAAINAAAANLIAPGIEGDPGARQMLASEVQQAAQRLNRLVGNLLDIARLESGHVTPKLEWSDVADLIQVSLKRVEKELSGHRLVSKIPAKLPLVKLDFVLMEQSLVNVLLNAAVYTPPGTEVELEARTEGGSLLLTIADRGPGLPADGVEQVFEKFYRGPVAPTGGTGLGLSIVKGFVEAQGGTIQANNRTGGGAAFTIKLPLGVPPEIKMQP